MTIRLDPPELQADIPQPARRQLNHFFHFDGEYPRILQRINKPHVFQFLGSRYVSWLPSFSVEVSHAQLVRTDHNAASNSQLDAMARQVRKHLNVAV